LHTLAASQYMSSPCKTIPASLAPYPFFMPDSIKQRLKKEGKTLKSFAAEHGFSYRTVRDVVRGIRRGYFGEGRKVRIALGLPVVD